MKATKTAEDCARDIARHLGIRGRCGGWLYSSEGKVIAQGWFAASQMWLRRGWIAKRGEPFGHHVVWHKVPCPLMQR